MTYLTAEVSGKFKNTIWYIFYKICLVVCIHCTTDTHLCRPPSLRLNRIILWKSKRITLCHTYEVWIFMFQIIVEEKERFLEHVWCDGLFKKSSLEFSHCNWIVASKN